MDLHNAFEVPLPPDRAWATLLDIPRIAPCMPGAELTEVVDARTFKGKVGVRLGPVALSFNGSASFEEIDDQAHRAKVKAQGTDTKGRGGASANVVFRLEPSANGSKVLVDTKLNLTGSVAQYGRGTGMIQAVATQLIGQFARNLQEELQRAPVAAGTATPPGDEVAIMAQPDAARSEPLTAPGPAAAADRGRIDSSMMPASAASAPTSTSTPPPARAPAKPISGFALLWAALLDLLHGLFRRRTGT